MQNKKKILNRLAGSSAILVTALSVGVPVQSAFANQTVEAQNQAGDGLSFAGRTLTLKTVSQFQKMDTCTSLWRVLINSQMQLIFIWEKRMLLD